MHLKKLSLLSFISLLIISISFVYTTAQPKPQSGLLKVGVAGSAPFIMDTIEQTGISLEIWQRMANLEHISYDLVPFADVSDALKALDSEKVDMVVGPISITPERIGEYWFTQPYYMTSLSIMSKHVSPSVWQRAKPFFSIRFLYAVCIFLFILCIVGTLLWLTERKHNPEQFPPQPAVGIANGMWCAIVTMSTTGYGDRAPETLWGRVIAGSWMVVSIIFATTMVAGIASTLTLSGFNTTTISRADQLRNMKVAVINDSPASKLVKRFNGRIVNVDNLEQGYQYLKEDKVKAIVYDRAQLLYLSKMHDDDEIAVSPQGYARQGYGFAVRPRSTLLMQLNEGLLTMQQSGSIKGIIADWIGHDSETSD